jgi:hypothetical protein
MLRDSATMNLNHRYGLRPVDQVAQVSLHIGFDDSTLADSRTLPL